MNLKSERSYRGYKIFPRSKEFRNNYDMIRWDREEKQKELFDEEDTGEVQEMPRT